MTDEMKQKPDIDEAVLALREEYEQTAVPAEMQPAPKVGKEIKARRFPRIVSYLMGVMAVTMLVIAVFLFNVQAGQPEGEPVAGAVEMSEEGTAVNPDNSDIIPTPPLLVAPPLPQDIPLPPQPTPWPTPPIAPDSQ